MHVPNALPNAYTETQLESDKERVATEEKEEGARMKQQRNHEKGWEKTREKRVGSWRNFVKGTDNGKKVKGLKPPKGKKFDDDKAYMQRPTTEQFRPPPMVAPKPQRE